jgi:uncharacterized protein YdcH (DUF465 family)
VSAHPKIFDPYEPEEVAMSLDAVSLREHLLKQNEQYRQLDAQHREYESRLQSLTDKVVLSDDEQLEETMLKKKKLQIKDKMEEIARQARAEAAHP